MNRRAFLAGMVAAPVAAAVPFDAPAPATLSASPAPPDAPADGSMWIDTTTGAIAVYAGRWVVLQVEDRLLPPRPSL